MIGASVVARRLGVTTQTVRNWIKSKRIRGSRTPGGFHQVPASELARLQKEQKVQSADGSN
jgi:excisionase family DNA binding protein